MPFYPKPSLLFLNFVPCNLLFQLSFSRTYLIIPKFQQFSTHSTNLQYLPHALLVSSVSVEMLASQAALSDKFMWSSSCS